MTTIVKVNVGPLLLLDYLLLVSVNCIFAYSNYSDLIDPSLVLLTHYFIEVLDHFHGLMVQRTPVEDDEHLARFDPQLVVVLSFVIEQIALI